jgi:protein arginine kinase activator
MGGMGLKCDQCDNEATVHEVIVRNGERTERHLCEAHARDAGVVRDTPTDSVSSFMQKLSIASQGISEAGKSAGALSCPQCGLSFAKFRAEGLLGCPGCYEAFEDKLAPLLVRAHDGGEHHTGRVPKRAGAMVERQQRLMVLRKELGDAVAQELYERAADLRDQISTLERGGSDTAEVEPGSEGVE